MSQSILPDISLSYARIVERYAHFFDKPEVRLRFFNKTLTQQTSNCEKLSRSLSRFKFIERTRLYQLMLDWWLYVLIIRELNQFSRAHASDIRWLSLKHKVPFGSRVLFHLYTLRYILGVLGILVVMAGFIGLSSLVLKLIHNSDAPLTAQNRPTLNRSAVAEGTIEVARYLPDYKPVKVWLVEQKDNFERYSNGLRIIRDYETDNHGRGYKVFQQDGGKIDPVLYHEPIGIVYHTSESEVVPFISENNHSIESHSNGLLKFVQTHRSYNYVIDRFGQIFRIVRDDQAANHAGNSVWMDRKGLYVGLNESFLGVCFETRSEANQEDEQLTEAQLLAGRLLTQVLRSRYNIDDADCVTHGLVSVNPQKMLIAYHHDWVRNFPFAAMGLSNKYEVPTVSISFYGCTYDTSVIGYAGGEIWSGAKLAEEEFKDRVGRAQLDVAEYRRRMRDLYREQLSGQNVARGAFTGNDRATQPDTLDTAAAQSFDSELQGEDE
jgi:hypothetical protein